MSARLLVAACAILLTGCLETRSSEGGDDRAPRAPRGSSNAAEPAPDEAPSDPDAPRTEAGGPEATAAPDTRTFEPPQPGEQVAVPAGTVRVGSRPGTVGRDARSEADLEPAQIPGFHIDRLPYPNDPTQPPRTDVTREQAAELCAEQGKRLCTELEWERACKGDGLGPFPGGAELDVERCDAEPRSCASPFGVIGLGVQAAEWTASDAGPGLARGEATAVVRGARPDADAVRHRCGARRAADPTTHSDTTGFRCCRGERPDARYPEPPVRRHFADKQVEATRLRDILQDIPELAAWAADFDPRGPMGVAAALGHSEPPEQAPNGWATSTAPVLVWSPVRGEVAWVLTGTEGGSTVLAVIQPTRDGFVHAASFVLEDEARPIAVLHTPGEPTKLQWTACWSCTGESGTIVYRREEATFAVLHH